MAGSGSVMGSVLFLGFSAHAPASPPSGQGLRCICSRLSITGVLCERMWECAWFGGVVYREYGEDSGLASLAGDVP